VSDKPDHHSNFDRTAALTLQSPKSHDADGHVSRPGRDQIAMNPRVFLFLLVASVLSIHDLGADDQTASRWELKTDDTEIVLLVANNILYLAALQAPAGHGNWIGNALAVPFPGKISGQHLDWKFQDATVDSTQGTKVTLRFTCASPNLELLSVWWAHPGTGPVEYGTSIRNNTDGDLAFDNRDVISADLSLTMDASTVLHRFVKLADVRNNPHPETPVLTTPLATGMDVVAYTRNAINDHPAEIPFQVFDVNSTHGLYIGYEWSFGQFDITASGPQQATYRAILWASGQTKLARGKTFHIPSIYLGIYTGDLDDGGNQFKRWFWKYKMTATLRNNPGEPLLEYCVPGNEAGLEKFFADYPVAKWGGELAKIDVDWLPRGDGPNQDWFSNEVAEWNPNPAKWPNGMKGRAMAHAAGQKLALYMPHSYQKCDLATEAGRELEKNALLKRYDDGIYDYYRSDFVVEGSLDYLKHEGFMEVLDALIAQRPDFRYEHCSAGGTLKDFSTLQRLTFMTTDDSATPDGHRQAMYACTYMINPVQLKADIAISGGPGSDKDPVWVRYCLRTGFMGANMSTGWGSYTPAMIEETKAHWPLYTSKMRPILRGADVYHILPPCNHIDWDGLQYQNIALRQGAVLLFKPAAQTIDHQIIKLKGLQRNASYTLTFQDRTWLNATETGAQLMDEGINVTGMTGPYASEIIWLQQVGG
jgi:hypothetical protein